ncbi:MAG TPA: type II 3-dehydroquinate dehydratase [Candidatus Binataceae bacterium]|jgi:3-dehydroquinate dehydratase-2
MVSRSKSAPITKPDARRVTPAVLVVHGPNLNLLGEREPAVYGSTTLSQIDAQLNGLARELGLALETFQSNSEGAIVDRIQAARGRIDLLIINPAAYTHTSVAIRDVILATGVECIEMHLSNVYKREPFRHHSTIADIAVGRIMGFGADGYLIALRAARNLIDARRAKT